MFHTEGQEDGWRRHGGKELSRYTYELLHNCLYAHVARVLTFFLARSDCQDVRRNVASDRPVASLIGSIRNV